MKDFDELAEGLSDLPEWNIMEDRHCRAEQLLK